MSDMLLQSILTKIESKTVTADDFDALIQESMPESVRNRVRRRTILPITKRHVDDDNHQKISLPNLADRVQPKRKPLNTQSHGQAKSGQRHSSRAVKAAMEFIVSNYNKTITESTLATRDDIRIIDAIITSMLAKPNVNREWLLKLQGICRGK